MVALICGGRNFNDEKRIFHVLDRINKYYDFSLIIHGAATGADSLAGKWAKARNIPTKEFPADWSQGRSAGPIRNKRMLDEGKPDLIIAFPGGTGTENMVQQAVKCGIKVFKIRVG